MALDTGQSGTRFRSLGTQGAQSPTYFDPAKRREALFNTKEYDTPQYTAGGPISVDTSNNINAGPRVFGRNSEGVSGPESKEKLMYLRNAKRMMNYGKDDEAIEAEWERRRSTQAANIMGYERHQDYAAAQRNVDEQEIRAAADRDKYGISDRSGWSADRNTKGLNPFSRLTDQTTIEKLNANLNPGAAASQAGGNVTTSTSEQYDPWKEYTEEDRNGGAYAPGEYLLKKQKLQAQYDKVRLGSYVYNDTLRELWEGDAGVPLRNEWNKPINEGVYDDVTGATAPAPLRGIGMQKGRNPMLESGYSAGEGWVPGASTFATSDPFEDQYDKPLPALGSAFNTKYKIPSYIGKEAGA